MRGKLAAVILAAGQGTRMKSDRAKVLHEIGGEPLVAYPMRLALDLGAAPIALVIGHQADAVQKRVEALLPGKATFAVQAEQKGTGHAVMIGMQALEGFEGRVVVLYGDVPLLRAGTVERLLDKLAKDRLPMTA